MQDDLAAGGQQPSDPDAGLDGAGGIGGFPRGAVLENRQTSRRPDLLSTERGRPRSELSYLVRTQDDTVGWSDTSRPLPLRDFKLALLAREVARRVCRLRR